MARKRENTHPYTSQANYPAAKSERPKKRRRGLKWFCIDLWWLHLITFCLVTMIVTLLLAYVGLPRIAQSDFNKATINVTGLTLSRPTPEGFHILLNGQLFTSSPFHPTIRPADANFYLEDEQTPFLTVQLPSTRASNGVEITVDQDVEISDQELFTDYTISLITQQTIVTQLKAQPAVQLGKLPTVHPRLEKTIPLIGFNNLNGIAITDLEILLTTQPDGANLQGNVKIPNPSVQSVELGNVEFSAAIPPDIANTDEPLDIGLSWLNDTFIQPGDNEFILRSNANQTRLLETLIANPSLVRDGLPILVSGRSVTVDGQDIPYLSAALRESSQRVLLEVGPALEKSGFSGIIDPGGVMSMPSPGPTGVPSVQTVPDAPNVPDAPTVSNTPSAPSAPDSSDVPGELDMQDVQDALDWLRSIWGR